MKEKEYLTLEKNSAYKMAFDFANNIWDIVNEWDYFAKHTVGKQLVRAVDSVSANIAEGFGRYTKKDKTRFYRISIGSLFETEDWLKKSAKRKLIVEETHFHYKNVLNELKKEIYNLINFTNEKLKY